MSNIPYTHYITDDPILAIALLKSMYKSRKKTCYFVSKLKNKIKTKSYELL